MFEFMVLFFSFYYSLKNHQEEVIKSDISIMGQKSNRIFRLDACVLNMIGFLFNVKCFITVLIILSFS